MSNAEKARQMRATLDAQRKDLELKNSLVEKQLTENFNNSRTEKAIRREKEDTKAAPYWDDVRKKAQSFKKPTAQNSYMEWNTSVMEMFELNFLLSRALIFDNSAGRILDFVWNKGESIVDNFGEKTSGESVGTKKTQQLQSLIHQVTHKIKGSPIEPLHYSICFDETGKLTTEVTQGGLPLSPQQQQLFDVGFIVWAEERGCTFDYTNQILTDDNGLVMTHEKLKALNQDDDNGLNAFFEGKFELKIAQNPAPRP